MKETKLSTDMLDVIASNNGLSMYLSGLLTGRPDTPRSSLYNIKGKTKMLQPDEILHTWLEQLSVLENGSDYEQEVFHFDSAQLQKWGPQGGIAPISELMDEVVLPTFVAQPRPHAFDSQEWEDAKREVAKKLHRSGCKGLRPVPYHRVIDDMRARDTLESNSGWPLFTTRHKPSVVAQSIQEAEDGRWKTYPAIALFRNYNRKTRLVWMFPMSANLVEGSFFQPLQRILMNTEDRAVAQFLAPWRGFNHVREVIQPYYKRRFGQNGLAIAASDFSSTDAHFQLDATMEVCEVLETCFQPQYRALLRESMTHMHNIPLVVGPDSEIVGAHGVSSGSNWTNFVETIFDMIFSEFVDCLEGYSFMDHEDYGFGMVDRDYRGLYAIGDDMTWLGNGYDADFAVRLEAYGKEVGQQIKAEKTTNDPDKVKSLQRLFQAGYLNDQGLVRAVYPTIRALKSLVYPERMHKKALWSKDMSAVRTFMILENTVDHPLFQAFCFFVSNGDPYLREFARFPKHKLDAALRQSKLVPGLNTTYNQERRDTSLSEFASIKFVANL